MVKLFSVILVMAFSSITPSYAIEDLTAYQLKLMCTTSATLTLCASYIYGVRSGIQFTEKFHAVARSEKMFCQPDLGDALAESATLYVTQTKPIDDATLNRYDASVMFVGIMKEKFPCQ